MATLQNTHPHRLGLPKPLQVTSAGKAPQPLGLFPPRKFRLRPANAGSPHSPLKLDSVSFHRPLPTLLELFFLPHGPLWSSVIIYAASQG